ncbi:phenoloxidase-activating factor 3-like [Maniola jurtina]|uniref:phenoloxidase-activating factor 3-like n=1 Tax=Maniola jurtina TaxID=191418 RepID=UPI001E6889FC|nr:phenoloxidase-activating factor 3-like [Maniola jurtina]
MGTIYLVLSLCVLQVHSMALKGPVLTRYQPCGLGVIYFDKITDMLWRAEINLELYQNLGEVEIIIVYEKEMALFGVSHNSTVFINNDSHNFTFIPNEGVPDKYHIYTSIKENTTASVPIVKSFTLNRIVMCNDFLKAADTISSLDATQPDDTEYRHTCGRRSLSHTELNYVRTESVQAGDWPWHVAILIKKPFTDLANYHCGGNVISTMAILTAGHCVLLTNGKLREATSIVIEAGVTNLRDVDQIGRQTRFAERIILHPGYSEDQATSDLAIVVVNKLRYTEYVQPICVWGPVYDKTELFGKQAVITGFGTTEQNLQSDTLRSTNTMVQNDTICNAFAPDLYPKLLNEFTFCAGFGPNAGINPRNGDSGGGLFIPTKQADHKVSWFLRGILSKCGHRTVDKFCDPKYYVIYTDVGPHYGWIYHNAGLIFSSNIMS